MWLDWLTNDCYHAGLQCLSSRVLTLVSKTPIALIDEALDEIARSVILKEKPGAPTHTAIIAEGLERPEVAVALGRYLVGALAG